MFVNQLKIFKTVLTADVFVWVKIMDLIPDKPMPEHWTPISMNGNTLTLCRLDFSSYSAKPYAYPMFKDFVAVSKCSIPGNTRTATIRDLLVDIDMNAGTRNGRVVYPSGFVFHESRVGSTLIANLLASDPDNMVFSEVSNYVPFVLYILYRDETAHAAYTIRVK